MRRPFGTGSWRLYRLDRDPSELYDKSAAEPERLARHCADGGLVEEAIGHYQRAGEQALARLANAEATEYFGRALDALAALPESDAS